MFCPNCRTEYKEGITVCADCGAQLVALLPPEQPDSAELITVLKTRNLSTLVLAKSILEDAEIEFVAKGEFPMEQIAVGPVEIQVDRANSELALELLEGLAEGKAAPGLIEPLISDDDEEDQ